MGRKPKNKKSPFRARFFGRHGQTKAVKKPVDDNTPKPEERKTKIKTPQLLRGMKDILPNEQKYWYYIINKAEALAWGYTFGRIDTPILESTDLFVRTIGKQTDIIEKEMFSFEDQGGDSVTLRPEGTASIARAFIEHGMINLPQPVKLFYCGPMFRYDRPQAGRQRQFHQVGFEVLGDASPVVDAQLVILAHNFCKELGLDVNAQINSIGCSTCRTEYKKELIEYFRSKRSSLCENCKRRLAKNPLRLLDCKEEGCVKIREEAPQLVDWLCEPCKNHFVKVLEYLDEAEVPYILNPYLVRGLDYYNRTAFEIWPADNIPEPEKKKEEEIKSEEKKEEEKEIAQPLRQNALGGGGRYDTLIYGLGGRDTPACGFAIGIERLILKIKEAGVEVDDPTKPQIFLAQLGETAKRKALVLFEELRRNNIRVAESFAKDSLRQQLEMANRLGVKLTLILGQKEVMDGTILIRDMEGGIQEVIDFNKTIEEIKKRLDI
ncbi:MAG: histidine--tRNA ligase [Patescibacteria group bacterium]|nr:histidine--tRNA ligase [Patescibacteria group bacterium]MDD5490238.1 histidine--tRNA ligase [Patescibacteria group bacterium]